MNLHDEQPETGRAGGKAWSYAPSRGKTGSRMDFMSGKSPDPDRGKRPDSSSLGARHSDKSPPVRKEKVEEARKKRQNGDYDSREVYRKIAERLIDHFGI